MKAERATRKRRERIGSPTNTVPIKVGKNGWNFICPGKSCWCVVIDPKLWHLEICTSVTYSYIVHGRCKLLIECSSSGIDLLFAVGILLILCLVTSVESYFNCPFNIIPVNTAAEKKSRGNEGKHKRKDRHTVNFLVYKSKASNIYTFELYCLYVPSFVFGDGLFRLSLLSLLCKKKNQTIDWNSMPFLCIKFSYKLN